MKWSRSRNVAKPAASARRAVSINSVAEGTFSPRSPKRNRCGRVMRHPLVSPPDVLVPEGGALANEPPHHCDTTRVLEHIHSHAPVPQQVFLAPERGVLADYDAWDAVEQNRPRAHGAWGQGRVQDTPGIHGGRESAGVLQRVHLRVEYGAGPLHAAVVPPADDPTLVDQDGADRDAPLGQPGLRLSDGGIQEFVHRPSSQRAEARVHARQRSNYSRSNSNVLTTRIRFTRVLVGLNGPDSSFPSRPDLADPGAGR